MWLAGITGAVAVLCALLALFSLASSKPVLALAFFATAWGALAAGQQVG